MDPTPTERAQRGLAPAAPSRAKKFAVNVLLLGAAIAFSLVVLEIGARLFLPSDAVKNPLLEPNAEYLYRLKPGARVERAAPAGADRPRISFAISSQGWRDREFGPKQPGEYRIGILGDSFTMGWSVAQEHTFSALLEEKFKREGYANVTVMNFGTGGTGPWQQRDILRDRGFPLKPDLVLHQLFLGNDLADSLGELGRSTQAYLPVWEARMRQFRRMKYPQYRADRWLEMHLRSYSAVRSAIGLPRFQHWLDHAPFFPHPEGPELPPAAKRPAYLEQDITPWYDDLSLALDRMMTTLHAIAGDCAAHNAGYAIFSVPPHAEVSNARWQVDMQRVTDGSEYERGSGTQRLYARLAQEDLPAFSVMDVLHAAPDPDTLYIAGDGHFTVKGDTIIADRLYDYLVHEYFPAHPDPRVNVRSGVQK